MRRQSSAAGTTYFNPARATVNDAGQSVANATVTDLTAIAPTSSSRSSDQDGVQWFDFSATNWPRILDYGNYIITLTVEWDVFAGDRYIEINVPAPPRTSPQNPLGFARVRDAGTPDGDIQTVTQYLLVGSGAGFPALMSFNVFQASGAAQLILASRVTVLRVTEKQP